MEVKGLVRYLHWLILSLVMQSAFAVDLMEVYQKSLQQDPEFRVAKSHYMAEKEKVAIAEAALLPEIDLDADLTHTRTQYQGATSRSLSTVRSYGLSLSQPIFHAGAWAGLRGAKAHVKQAYANYLLAKQDLLWRVVKRYTDVLVAEAQLWNVQAEQRAVASALAVVKREHGVGASTQTAMNEAQAAHDAALAQVIAAESDMAHMQEQLFQITGVHYRGLSRLAENFSLLQPNPIEEEAWVTLAFRHNNKLVAAQYGKQEAKATQRQEKVNRVPTLSVSADYDYTNTRKTGSSSITRAPSVGLAISMPIYHGGSLSAQRRQASWLLAESRAVLLAAHRQVESDTRQAYRDIVLGLSKVKADQQALLSRRSAWDSVQAAYRVGQRAMTDLLQVQADWFAAKRLLTKDFYAYVMSTLSLKRAVGQLSVADIAGLAKQMVAADAHTPDEAGISGQSGAGVVVAGMADGVGESVSSSGDFFTIQLVSVSQEGAALHFIREHDLVHRAHYERLADKDGEQHYAVLMGRYTSREEARRALAQLPGVLQALQPWVRQRR